MNSKIKHYLQLLFIGILLALLFILGVLWVPDNKAEYLEILYSNAVEDAVTAEPEEIEPLIVLKPEETLTSWDSSGRVLLLSWHSSPKAYPAGAEITLSERSVWTFTDREIAAWYKKSGDGVKDWELRLEQLIGLPADCGYTHVSGFWVFPGDVIRPAYETDIKKQMQLDFPENTDGEYKKWFEANVRFSYEESAYPWTRLGYTYDWADNDMEYGLTEFLIKRGALVKVGFTKTTEEFLQWIRVGEH